MKLTKYALMFASAALYAPLNAITINLKDGKSLIITDAQFKLLKEASQTIGDMLKDTGKEDEDILLSEVDESILRIIINLLQEDEEKGIQNYLNMQSYKDLHAIASVANYLDISSIEEKTITALVDKLKETIEKKELGINIKNWLEIPLNDNLKGEIVKKLLSFFLPTLLQRIDIIPEPLFEKNALTKVNSSNIEEVAFSPTQCALLAKDKISIFNLETEKRWGTLDKNFSVDLMKFSSDGESFFLGFRDGTLKGYDQKKGEKLFERSIVGRMNPVLYELDLTPRNFYSLVINKEKKIIAVATRSPNIILLSFENPDNIIATLASHKKAITSVLFHPTEQILISGSKDSTIKIWNAKTYSLIKTLQGHDGQINALAFNADGSLLFSAGADKKIIIWQLPEFKKIAEKTLSDQVTHFVVDNKKEVLITADIKGAISLLDLTTLMLIKKFQITKSNTILSLALTPDNKLLTGVRKEPVRKWNLNNLSLVETLSLEQLFLMLLINNEGFDVYEKNRTLLGEIFESLPEQIKPRKSL